MDEAVMVAVLVGVLEVVKKTGFNPKFIPVLSLFLGAGIGIIYSGFELKEGILSGIVIGLSAVGLYSGGTNVYEGIKNKLL